LFLVGGIVRDVLLGAFVEHDLGIWTRAVSDTREPIWLC
jgi:tRNA nucleotidyltransferase/poly(A) polymerase